MRVLREHSGLVLAEDAIDERWASEQIKQLNPRFALHKERRDDAPGGWMYRVVHIWSDEQPYHIVFDWIDDQCRPLPLSSGIVEEVKRHMLGARNSGLGREDEHNRQLQEKRLQAARAESLAIADHYRPWLDRGRVGITLADVKRKPYWARNKNLRQAR